MPKQQTFKYIAVVVVETSEKVTKKAVKEHIEQELGSFEFRSDDISRVIERVRVRSVDLD